MTEDIISHGIKLPEKIKITQEMQNRCSDVSELFSDPESSNEWYVYAWLDDSEFATLVRAGNSYEYTYYIETPIMRFHKIPIEEFYEV